MNKQCAKCKEAKGVDCFSKGTNKKDGLYSYCKNCEKAQNAENYKNNKEKELARVKLYQATNKEKLSESRKKNFKKNRAYQNDYSKKRRKEDPVYLLAWTVRKTVSELFRGKKSKKSLELLGCPFETLKAHLEGLFQSGMSWENYGKWHIDHKYPLARANSVEELEKLCHFSNLQPLWATDNLSKGTKLDWQSNL